MADLLSRVDQLLREGRPRAGPRPLARDRLPVGPERPGRLPDAARAAGEAIDALRDLVFNPSGFGFRPDADPVFQANYATALLLDGNAQGSGASSAASATVATRRSPGWTTRSAGGGRG